MQIRPRRSKLTRLFNVARTGRPKVKIDLVAVEKLGALQCTMDEISAFLGIAKSTLSTRKDFSDAYKRGLSNGKSSLRRKQWKLADTSAAMAIWLGKQYLGQRDHFDNTNNDDEPTAANILKALAQSTPTRYAIPATNGSGKIQDSPGGKAKRKD